MKKLSLEEIFSLAKTDLPAALRAVEKIKSAAVNSADMKGYIFNQTNSREIIKKLLEEVAAEDVLKMLYLDRDAAVSRAAKNALVKRCKKG